MTTILCNTKDLHNALIIADMGLLDKPSHPILLNARFSIGNDLGEMDVIVTTLKESIKLTLTLAEPAPESFELCCPVGMLLKVIGKLDKDQQVGLDFNLESSLITITQGNGKYMILGRSADEFPACEEMSQEAKKGAISRIRHHLFNSCFSISKKP